jgi:aminoglycoside 3'-phosphotransferase-2
MSGARIWRLRTSPERYLKIAEASAAPALREEIARTHWLGAHGIRVGRITGVFDRPGWTAMVTEAVPGMSADEIDWSPERVLTVLGRGLARLHALPLHDCPFDESAAVRLARARAAVERGKINPAHFAARNRDISPRTLFDHVAARVPREELVVVHGDATFSNMLVDSDGTVGFIDCGHAGRADRYLDLGVLAAEIVDHFGRDALRVFARAYGVSRWNAAKALYYADLYEFF